MNVQLTRLKDHVVAGWAGGATTELCIRPATAACPDRNFAFRVSSATVELAESTFSDFTGFVRHIMPLEGGMELWHNGEFAATLRPYDCYTFDGSWKTRSLGTCVDFNLIHTPALHGALHVLRENKAFLPVPHGHTGIYARCSGLVVTASAFPACTLNAGDFLLLETAEDETPQAIRLESSGQGVRAVVATVQGEPAALSED